MKRKSSRFSLEKGKFVIDRYKLHTGKCVVQEENKVNDLHPFRASRKFEFLTSGEISHAIIYKGERGRHVS